MWPDGVITPGFHISAGRVAGVAYKSRPLCRVIPSELTRLVRSIRGLHREGLSPMDGLVLEQGKNSQSDTHQ